MMWFENAKKLILTEKLLKNKLLQILIYNTKKMEKINSKYFITKTVWIYKKTWTCDDAKTLTLNKQLNTTKRRSSVIETMQRELVKYHNTEKKWWLMQRHMGSACLSELPTNVTPTTSVKPIMSYKHFDVIQLVELVVTSWLPDCRNSKLILFL